MVLLYGYFRRIKTLFFLSAFRPGQVADSDRIMVISDGLVAEFDTPAALLARPDSLYTKLIRESAA
jgi:ABC-type multidrug transport system fused ATPase/permease subunit